MSTLPPRHVSIAGAMFIALSAWAAVGVLAAWVDGRAGLDLTIFTLPVGYGILLGNESARSWGRILAIIGLILNLLGAAFTGYDLYKTVDGDLPPSELAQVVGFSLSMAMFSYIYFVLKRDGCDEWFADMQPDDASAKAMLWSVGVISASAAFLYHLQIWQTNETGRSSFIYHVEAKPYDKVTGESLGVSGFNSVEFEQANGDPSRMPRPRWSIRSTRELEAIGVAVRKFDFTLKCAGYRDQKVVIDKDTGKVIDVPMEPLSPKTAEDNH